MTCSPRVHEGDVRAVAELGAGAGRARRAGGAGGLGVSGWRLPRRWGPRALGPRTRRALRGGRVSALPEPFAETAGWCAQPRRRRPTPPRLHPRRATSPPRRCASSPVWCGVLGRLAWHHARRVVTDTTVGTGGEHETSHVVGAGAPPVFCSRAMAKKARAPHRRCPGVPGRRHPFPRYHRDLGRSSGCPPRRPRLASGEPPTALLEASVTGERCTRAALAGVATGSSP